VKKKCNLPYQEYFELYLYLYHTAWYGVAHKPAGFIIYRRHAQDVSAEYRN